MKLQRGAGIQPPPPPGLSRPSKKINKFIKIKLGWKAINQVNCIKYLGIFIESTLSWKPRVTELSKNLPEIVEFSLK